MSRSTHRFVVGWFVTRLEVVMLEDIMFPLFSGLLISVLMGLTSPHMDQFMDRLNNQFYFRC